MSNESYSWKDAKIGALWAKQRPDGSTTYNGRITVDGKEISIHVFPSKFAAENPNSPALTIHLSPPPQNQGQQQPAAAPRQAAAPPVAAQQPTPQRQAPAQPRQNTRPAYPTRPVPQTQAAPPQQASQPHDVTL